MKHKKTKNTSRKNLNEESERKIKTEKISDKKNYSNEVKELTQTWNEDLCE